MELAGCMQIAYITSCHLFLQSFPPASVLHSSPMKAKLLVPRPAALLFQCPSPSPSHRQESNPPSLPHHERTKARVSDTTLQIPFTPQPPPPVLPSRWGCLFLFSLFYFRVPLNPPRVLQNGCGPLLPHSSAARHPPALSPRALSTPHYTPSHSFPTELKSLTACLLGPSSLKDVAFSSNNSQNENNHMHTF